MRTYAAFYRNRQATVQAESSLAAQKLAATILKAKHPRDVAIILTDDGQPRADLLRML
jgi:hypothetical protein